MMKSLCKVKSRGTLIAVIAAGLMLAVAPATQATNLLSNPGFEDGATGPIGDGVPDWNVWANSGWHHDDAGKTIDTKAIKFWWDDSFIWQDFPASAGTDYLYSVLTLSGSDDPLNVWNGNLKAEFYDNMAGTGTPLLATDVDKFYSASDPQDTWVELSGTVTAPPTTVMGRIILSIGDWNPNPSGSLNFDQASVVPEPATLGFLVLGVVCILRRRES